MSKKAKKGSKGKQTMAEYQKSQVGSEKKKFKKGGLEFSTTEFCVWCQERGALAVACDKCSSYYHLTCVEVTEDELVASGTWICPDCVDANGTEPEPPKERIPEKVETKKRARPSRASLIDEDFQAEIEPGEDQYSLDRKISLPAEIAKKYKRFIELTDIHHAALFKDFDDKTDEEKEALLDKCQEEIEEMLDEAYVSEAAKAEKRHHSGSNVTEDLKAVFAQFLAWQRMTRLSELMPADHDPEIKRFKKAPIPENDLRQDDEEDSNDDRESFSLVTARQPPPTRPPPGSNGQPPPTQAPPGGKAPVVYFTPRNQAHQFKYELSPNTRALRVIQTNPNQVLPVSVYPKNKSPTTTIYNSNNNMGNNTFNNRSMPYLPPDNYNNNGDSRIPYFQSNSSAVTSFPLSQIRTSQEAESKESEATNDNSHHPLMQPTTSDENQTDTVSIKVEADETTQQTQDQTSSAANDTVIPDLSEEQNESDPQPEPQ
jgi:hypothetical protein